MLFRKTIRDAMNPPNQIRKIISLQANTSYCQEPFHPSKVRFAIQRMNKVKKRKLRQIMIQIIVFRFKSDEHCNMIII